MQIPKLSLAACAAICALSLSARGDDKPDQVKAREALEQKLRELDAQPAQPPPPPAPAPRKSPKPAAEPSNRQATQPRPTPPAMQSMPATTAAPVVQAPPPTPVAAPSTPSPSAVPISDPTSTAVALPPPADPEVIAKARDALHQKMQELGSPGAEVANTAPVAPAQTPAPASVQPAAVPPIPAPAPSPVPPPASVAIPPAPQAPMLTEPSADPESIAKAREAMRAKLQQLPPGLGEEPVPAGSPKLTRVNHPLNFKPLEGPALGISSDKQQRLSVLLQQYKTDQITPEQYHAERAKILSE